MLRPKTVTVGCLVILSACQGAPDTNEKLTARALQAVDRKLGVQAQFSLVETTVSRQIACGHASADSVSRDWVYDGARVILDDDPDFDAAALECDEAIRGGGTKSADNLVGP
jgi:hypothetical protein